MIWIAIHTQHKTFEIEWQGPPPKPDDVDNIVRAVKRTLNEALGHESTELNGVASVS